MFNPRENFSTEIENIFFDIQLPKSKPILVGVLYRPPITSGFLDKLTLAISKTDNFDNQEVYVLGDLNINLSSKDDLSRIILLKNYQTELKGIKSSAPSMD